MKRLVLALFAEGPTDERFFPPVIQRTSEQILTRYGQRSIKVGTRIIPKDANVSNRDEGILQAAVRAANCNVLIVHCDADHPTAERALKERFRPGYELVQREKQHVCKSLVPIVPVRMTEAWMLAADYDLLRDVIGTSVKAQDLGLVNKVKQVESDPDPKQTLKQILQRAYADRSGRHREIDLDPLYRPFGRRINLDRLSNVPSYYQFVSDLTATLQTLNLIQ